jgi:Swt1-like HEPN
LEQLYPFIYKALLTEESLDKAGRIEREQFGTIDATIINSKLSLEMLDEDAILKARKMSLVYTAIHAFENTVRDFVMSTMVEVHKQEWWDKVSTKIQSKVTKRIEEESKLRWHGARGGSEIEYCDFGDLSSIIVTNWEIFEPVLVDLEWAKSLLAILERSRNVVMHGGELGLQDIERIGGNIRDWVRQAG